MTRARKLAEMTTARREKLATAAFDPEKVATEATKLAAAGFDRLCVNAGTLARLDETKAAKAAVSKLVAAGFKVDWEPIVMPANAEGNLTRRPITVKVMVIEW